VTHRERATIGVDFSRNAAVYDDRHGALIADEPVQRSCLPAARLGGRSIRHRLRVPRAACDPLGDLPQSMIVRVCFVCTDRDAFMLRTCTRRPQAAQGATKSAFQHV